MHRDEEQTDLLIRLLARMLADRAAGGLQPLARYLEAFPGREEMVAAEYFRQQGSPDDAGGDRTDGTGRGARLFGGRYRLVEEVGRGGQGVVYRAEDEVLGRRVALKVLHASVSDRKRTLRLLREAKTTSGLEHPGICPVYETGEADGVAFIAMRFVEGKTMARVIAERGAGRRLRRAEIMESLATFEDLARTLHAAHEAGVVHRDVKPGNVMLRDGAGPVVLDFGLARGGAGDAPAITRTGEVFGTLAYMAPEQLDGDPSRIDRRADVWSLGVCLYELLTGVRPFHGTTEEATLLAIRREEPMRCDRRNPEIPRDLAAVVATALEKPPPRRYRSAAAFADDLARVAGRRPILARPPGPLVRAGRWVQRNPAVAAFAAAAFLILLAGLVVATVLAEGRAAALRRWELAALAGAMRQCLEDEEGLWPIEPELVARADAWIARADAVVAKLPDAGRALESIRSDGPPRPEEEAAAAYPAAWRRLLSLRAELAEREALRAGGRRDLDSAIARARRELVLLESRLFGRFEDPAQGEMLATLVAAGGDLARAREAVLERRRRAATIRDRSIVAHREAWDACLAACAATPAYAGLSLSPQMGLQPLRRDPESGLFEFLDVETGEPPAWDEDRERWRLAPETGLVLVLLPGGRREMGGRADDDAREEDEVPPHEVLLDAFFISKYEVTQAQWTRLALGWNPSLRRSGVSEVHGETPGPTNPVENLSWEDAVRVLERHRLALPTEAQWEYACRAGSATPWSTGQGAASLQGFANVLGREYWEKWPDQAPAATREIDDGRVIHAPVGSYRANPFGLHDMHGNVIEWCLDVFDRGAYRSAVPRPGDGLRAPPERLVRVSRGGSFGQGAREARSANRIPQAQDQRNHETGVRPVRRVLP